MPQKDLTGLFMGLRQPEDGVKFERAIKQMGSLYASMAATAVLQLQNVADPNVEEHKALKDTFQSVLVVLFLAESLFLPKGEPYRGSPKLRNAHQVASLLDALARGGAPHAILAYWATIELPFESEKEATAAVKAFGTLPGRATWRQVGKTIYFDVRRSFLELIEALLKLDVSSARFKRYDDCHCHL